jgi:hypothetical protein
VTFVEFIAPIRGGTNRALVLAAMYFLHRYDKMEAVRAEDIRTLLKNARVPRAKAMNVPDVLNKSGHFVDSPGSDGGRRLWKLTTSGEAEVRTLLGLPDAEPEIEHDVSMLTRIAIKVKDPDAQGFVEESIKALSVGALRASVVFLWSGAIRTLQEAVWAKGAVTVNAAIKKHDPKAREVTKLDDFAYVKDVTTLLALQELGILDKGQRATLGEALDLRNRCGHPTKYKAGPKKVSSFIEDVVGIVF